MKFFRFDFAHTYALAPHPTGDGARDGMATRDSAAGTPAWDVVDHPRRPQAPVPVFRVGSHRNRETVQVVEILGSGVYDSDMKKKEFEKLEAGTVSRLTPRSGQHRGPGGARDDAVGSGVGVLGETCFPGGRRKRRPEIPSTKFSSRGWVGAVAGEIERRTPLAQQPTTWLTRGPGREAGPDGEAGWGEKVEVDTWAVP